MTARKMESIEIPIVVQLVKDFLHEAKVRYEDEYLVNLVCLYQRNDTNVCFVAVEDDKIVGCMLGFLNYNLFTSGMFACDRLFYVIPEARNKKACRQLYLAFQQWAKDQNCEELIISCLHSRDNDAMKDVMEYMGFTSIGYLMRKQL